MFPGECQLVSTKSSKQKGKAQKSKKESFSEKKNFSEKKLAPLGIRISFNQVKQTKLKSAGIKKEEEKGKKLLTLVAS